MWGRTKRVVAHLGHVLLSDVIPVWLSLVLMILGAGAAYYIAPLINEQFEIQAARREFLIKNLEDFSSTTRSLIDVVSKGVNERSQFKYDALVAEANPSIAKLQFSATQLVYIVPQNHEQIIAFQKTLIAMQEQLISHSVGSSSSELLDTSKSLMKQSLLIYDALLRKAGFSSER
jgi:hypothetical protein